MKSRESLAKLSTLALRQRRQGLVKQLPPVDQTLRGSLLERHLSCGKPNCRCARGELHGPNWYLTVTLSVGRTTGTAVATEQVEQVRRWIENHHTIKEHLEKISDINRELLRRERHQARKKTRSKR